MGCDPLFRDLVTACLHFTPGAAADATAQARAALKEATMAAAVSPRAWPPAASNLFQHAVAVVERRAVALPPGVIGRALDARWDLPALKARRDLDDAA